MLQTDFLSIFQEEETSYGWKYGIYIHAVFFLIKWWKY